MKWKIAARPCEMVPHTHGKAYVEDFAHIIVCYPIPFNWLAWLVREIHWWLRIPPAGGWEAYNDRLAREHWNNGFTAGYRSGHASARREWHSGYIQAQEHYDEAGR